MLSVIRKGNALTVRPVFRAIVRQDKATVAAISDPKSDGEGHVAVHIRQKPSQPLKINPALDLSFENSVESFKSKKNWELLRAIFVLKACSFNTLVDKQDQLMKWSRKLLGKAVFEKLMKQTFYGQFVAGEDDKAIKPIIAKNARYGVKSILDYSVEKDISGQEAEQKEESACSTPEVDPSLDRLEGSQKRYKYHKQFADRRQGVTSARTYFYEDEHQCDRNLDICLSSIDAVSDATYGAGFAAIKLTALGRPELLLKLSELLVQQRERGGVEYGSDALAALLEDDSPQMVNMMHRFHILAKHAEASDVRMMVDAEQTYFQPAISRLVMEMMRVYNTRKAVIFNTYQNYLKEAHGQILEDLALSEKEGFYFGCKLVRGAYMEQERARAEAVGYEDPINPDFEATTRMYHNVFEEVMTHIQRRELGKISVMVASHNEDTVRFVVEKMAEYGVGPQDKLICFGQLLGMCDQVSFSMGQAGYSVYKYVPYGPVEGVLPYLSRRAQENRGIMLKVQKERRLLRQELWRRLGSGQFRFTPPQP